MKMHASSYHAPTPQVLSRRRRSADEIIVGSSLARAIDIGDLASVEIVAEGRDFPMNHVSGIKNVSGSPKHG
jgi:hypothetical protein